jgi:hypothetical protein
MAHIKSSNHPLSLHRPTSNFLQLQTSCGYVLLTTDTFLHSLPYRTEISTELLFRSIAILLTEISWVNLSTTVFPKSKLKSLYDWQFTANQFVFSSSPLRTMTRDLFPQMKPYSNSPYVTPLATDCCYIDYTQST